MLGAGGELLAQITPLCPADGIQLIQACFEGNGFVRNEVESAFGNPLLEAMAMISVQRRRLGCVLTDVVRANIMAALSQNKDVKVEVFNVASGIPTSLSELYALIQQALNQEKREPLHRTDRPGDIKYSLANMEKTQKTLGFQPSTSLAEGLKRTAEWFGEQCSIRRRDEVAMA